VSARAGVANQPPTQNRAGRDASGAMKFCLRNPALGWSYFVSLQAFLALHDSEAHLLAFLQGAETRTLDGAEMHEHIGAVFTADEPETLAVVEPLDSSNLTIRHKNSTGLSERGPQRRRAGLLVCMETLVTGGFLSALLRHDSQVDRANTARAL
jgi:hypothetical protein